MVSGQEVLACLTHGEECFHGAGITLSQLPRLPRLSRLPRLAATAARPLRKSELGSGSGRLGRTVHRQTDASLTGNTALWDHSHQLQNLVRETRYNTVWSIIVN